MKRVVPGLQRGRCPRAQSRRVVVASAGGDQSLARSGPPRRAARRNRERLDDVFSAGYSVSAFTDWYSGEASVWVKRRVDKPVSKLPLAAQHNTGSIRCLAGLRNCAPSSWALSAPGMSGWHISTPNRRWMLGLSCNQNSSCLARSHNGPSLHCVRSVASSRRLARQRDAYGPCG